MAETKMATDSAKRPTIKRCPKRKKETTPTKAEENRKQRENQGQRQQQQQQLKKKTNRMEHGGRHVPKKTSKYSRHDPLESLLTFLSMVRRKPRNPTQTMEGDRAKKKRKKNTHKLEKSADSLNQVHGNVV